MQRALVRGIGDAYVRATVQRPGPPIDVTRARRQHAAYVTALRERGVAVRTLPPDEGLPDACFVEDQVVVHEGRGLVTRSGNPARRAEADAVAAALSEDVALSRMEEGCLDGGDVLRVGRTLYVGRSGRTDAAGVTALRRTFEPLGLAVREVEVRGALHLKCHCSSPAPGLVLLAEGFADPGLFDAAVELLPAEEAYAANAVGAGDAVLVAAGFPETARRLGARGLRVVPLEMDAIAAGDGSLTCLSVFY